MKHALVIGAGSFGSTFAEDLASKKCEVIVIEIDPDRAQDLRDKVTSVVVGDATEKELLEKFAKDVDVAVVCISEKMDSSILITHFLKELGVKKIIAKAIGTDHAKVLQIVGAHQTVFPEHDEAIRLATELVSPNVLDFVHLSDEFDIVEVAVPSDFTGKSIESMDLRKTYGLHVLAIKNALEGSVRVVPPPTYVFRPDDIMIVMGDVDSIAKIK